MKKASPLTNVVLLLCCCVAVMNAQTTQPASDPQAVALAEQSVAAITGRIGVTDVTLIGNVAWRGQASGTFRLVALGNGESRMDLSLSNGTETEIRDAQTGVSRGKWATPDNRSGKLAFHNTLTDAAWFFPALGSLAMKPNVVLTYVGQEMHEGSSVQHIHSHVYQTGPSSKYGPQHLSDMDFYLDSGTLLPVFVTFNVHPDNNAYIDLLTKVEFSQYEKINGVEVPTHIRRYQQGYLMLDLSVTGATFNSGPLLSLFAVN